jgi:adhesin transport system outer membrane protein
VPADPAQALAALTSPALAQAQAQHEEAQARVNAAKALHKPTLDLSLGRQHLGVGIGAKTVATATFSMPLYQGGQTDAVIRAAVAQALAAQDSLTETELLVKERVRLAYADLASAQARLKLAAQQRESGAKLVAGYKEQFRLARRTLLDLLNIQSEFASYQQAEALAQYDVKTAEFRITAALGQLAQSYSAQ